MEFRNWLESRTFKHDLKYVYHWDSESSWNRVLNKQKRELWVSPNKDWNDHWAVWMVSGQGDDQGVQIFYLHTIGMPRDLFRQHQARNKRAFTFFGNKEGQGSEFVIPSEEWSLLVPVGVKAFKRSELLKKHFRHLRRKEDFLGMQTGEFSRSMHPGATGGPVTDMDLQRWKRIQRDEE